ncbi:sodium-coupled monocarboxylate transporter 2-like [Neodiprion pinetum]|uniref:Sodium-coupled monocarboxylate transporter 2 n=1 Tax=Neodiprion lecontei TaxID=441921 RepID=A0A6J0BVV9_NEOLC|nr:sodium-coupled monocarboxylate transporter 2 [Neodiprion lecontei]XP_046471285.1 sodium-coupled monocarboxylate transporter 2-like [Neodiprion pinetum]
MSTNNFSLVNTIQNNVEPLTFGWVDYFLFVTMLCVSAVVGTYFGFFSKKQDTTTEYLLGGKTMSYLPVALSITASHLSGITLLGVPAESYRYGTQYAACIFTTFITGLVTSYVFLPVFYKLQLTSSFKYLEVRFSRSVRQFASVIFILNLILHTPIVVYGPALAFAQVTGFNLHYIALIIGLVCIFYTAVGGLKAVVWTDTIQFTVTVITLFTVLILGIISIGGFREIWRISEEGGRIIFFDMNPSPFVRTSFWGVSIGLTTTWISCIGISQNSLQRFLSVPSLSDARITIWIMCAGIIVVKGISVYTGLIMYSKYHDCDPIVTNTVSQPDQILPYYVMDIAGRIPGLPGLFLAALVSSALSSMSSALNTVAGTIWEDFISRWVPESETKEQTATRVMKATVVVLGMLCVALVLVAEQLGDIFTMSASMTGVTSGTTLGLFTLGMLVPWASNKGTIIGGIIGTTVSAWIVMGAQIHKINKNIRYDPLPTSTDNCPHTLNATYWTQPTLPPVKPEDEPMILFTVSFLYYSLVGYVTVVICGIIASYIIGVPDPKDLDRDHFSPLIHRFLPREKYADVRMTLIPTIPINPDKEKEAMQ